MDITDDLPEARRESQSSGRRIRFVVGVLVVVGAFYALASSMVDGGGTSYFVTAAEARSQLPKYAGQAVRVKGTVVVGTYQHAEGTLTHKFDIQEQGQVINVAYEGPMPDVFKEGIEVVAEGKLQANGTLDATEVVAKCPSKYEEGKVPEAMKKQMQQQSGR